MSSSFKAAENNAYNMNWSVIAEMTPDKELKDNSTLITLRKRSRDMVKNNHVVAGILQAFLNIVGAVNSVQPDSENKIQNNQAKAVVDEFMVDASFDNKTLPQLIEEIISSSFTDGDVLISLPLDTNRKGVQTVVEVIEANRIKTPAQLEKDDNVRHGVKYDSEGRILGYYVKKYNKIDKFSDTLENFDFYPAFKEYTLKSGEVIRRGITKLFKAPLYARPKASRQFPLITPILPLLKYLDDYVEAVIVGARVAACFAAFVKTTNPAGAFSSFTTEAGSVNYDPKDANSSRRVSKLFPGMVSYLKPTEDITFASPNRPNDNVDLFIVRLYKTISMYIRIPYPILFVDLVEVNYSSWRGGANEMKKVVGRWRRDINNIIDWVLKTILLEASVKEMLRGDVNKINIKKRWPVHGILDPEKEARANKTMLLNGTTSPQRICEEEGNVYEEIQKELLEDQLNKAETEAQVLAKKKELEKKYGIIFPENMVEPDNRQTKRRPGEQEGEDLDEDDAKERRKEDGNW